MTTVDLRDTSQESPGSCPRHAGRFESYRERLGLAHDRWKMPADARDMVVAGASVLDGHLQSRHDMCPEVVDRLRKKACLRLGEVPNLAGQGPYFQEAHGRAERAGFEPRRQCLNEFDLGNWQDALEAFAAVTYGQLRLAGSMDTLRLSELLTLMYCANSAAEARMAVLGFEVANPEETRSTSDYLRYHLMEMLKKITAEGAGETQRRRYLSNAAGLGSLSALSTVYEFWEDHLGDNLKRGQHWNAEALLLKGSASFEGHHFLQYAAAIFWGLISIVECKEAPPALPKVLNETSLSAWANKARTSKNALSSFSDTMRVNVTMKEQRLLLSWDESYRGRRRLDISVQFGAEPGGEIIWNQEHLHWWNHAFQYLPAVLAQSGCVSMTIG